MSRKIFLYAHGGSGNHGCEAIVRSTAAYLQKEIKLPITLISSKPEEDAFYGLGEFCNIIKDIVPFSRCSYSFVKAYLALKLSDNYVPMEKLLYKKSFSNVKRGDIALSIGGDNYCYADYKKYMMFHDMMMERGAKTVLWGCSVEPELLKDPEVAKDIARYELITARETISYEALKKVNPNTVLVSDPAFVLETIRAELTDKLKNQDFVGINISPMVIEKEKTKGITMENYESLISYILNRTTMNVALIPHVVWTDGDDRQPLQQLYEKYKDSDRIVLVDDCNAAELKGYIAACKFFVGARTHATIAAYSSAVPTLVVGYSVKARGIAKDLFGSEEGYVLPVQTLERTDDLQKAFCCLQEREQQDRKQLQKRLPEYVMRGSEILLKIRELVE